MYEASPVFTDVLLPFVGRVPALHAIVKTSPDTDVVRLGSVPTAVIEFTVVVEPALATLIVGALTEPAGVYVAVPDDAGDTVAVLFVVVFVLTETDPLGVNFPVDVSALPENVGCDTVPDGV